MRNVLIAAAALAGAPAWAAQPAAPGPNPRDEEMRQALPDPAEMKAMGEVAARAMDAMMDVPIGPLREAVEGRKLSPRERAETIGDQARREDPYFRERMRDQIGLATVAMGTLAEQMATIAPVLRRTLEEVEQRFEEAMRTAPQRPRDQGVAPPSSLPSQK